MTNYYCRLTPRGAEKLAQAATNGPPLTLAEIAVGDGNPAEAEPTDATVLVGERHRMPVNTVYSPEEDQSVVIIEGAVPNDVGGFDVNEVALFDADGELVAVANYPSTRKTVVTNGIGRVLLIRIMLDVGSVDNVALQIDPAMVMATRQFVTLAINALTQAITDGFLTKAGNLAALADKAESRTNLDVYSKGEGDERYLTAAGNLAALESKQAARDNLGIYSATEVDQRTQDSTTTIKGVNRHATGPETIAGEVDNASVTPAGLAAREAARAWASSDQVINTQTVITLPHPLGDLPKGVQLLLVCQVAELGYSVGDVIDVGNNSSSSDNASVSGATIKLSATAITLRILTSIIACHFDTGSYAAITPANWRLRVRAFV